MYTCMQTHAYEYIFPWNITFSSSSSFLLRILNIHSNALLEYTGFHTISPPSQCLCVCVCVYACACA